MRIDRALWRWMQRFARDERGIITVQNLFLTVACCGIGAVGLDVTSFFQARTHLQVAADTAAHAALYTRHHGRDEAAAKTAAIAVGTYGMPSNYGTVLATSNITFGSWNATTGSFAALPAGSTAMPSAARVVTDRAGDNPVGSFLFRIVGVNQMDVLASATYTIYHPACLSEGFIAQGVVDIQSNNTFLRGFCVHSNAHVETNNQNFFELGTIVSMPNKNDLVIPNSGFQQNTGLEQALRSGTYDMKELNRLRPGAALEQGVLPYDQAISTLGHSQTPWFLNSASALSVAPGSYGPASFTAGRVHTVTCSSNGDRLTLTGGTYSQVVIKTNCEVQLSGQIAMEDTILYTSNTSADSISASSGSTGLVLGKNDNCAARGGATILTRGGMRAAAKLQMYGGQVRLLGDFKFASGGNAEVTGQGVSVMAGGEIDGTTHMNISACGTGMDQKFETPFFYLAQ